jgi:hypothetical protein
MKRFISRKCHFEALHNTVTLKIGTESTNK